MLTMEAFSDNDCGLVLESKTQAYEFGKCYKHADTDRYYQVCNGDEVVCANAMMLKIGLAGLALAITGFLF